MESKSFRYAKTTNKISFFGAYIALILITFLLAPFALVRAASPSSGTLAGTTGTSVTWVGTATGGASAEGEGVTCIEGTTCDTFTLTLSGSLSDWTGKRVNVLLNWIAPATDYDLYIHKDTVKGVEVTRSAAGPTIQEQAFIDPSVSGTGIYVVHVVYFAATAADQYNGTASVENKAASGPAPTPPPVSTAKAPTYTNYPAPAANPTGPATDTNLGSRAGEPTIGLNWSTGKAMFIAGLQTLRISFDDSISPASATWVQKSAPNTNIQSFDPLLFTDWRTNRTFVSQLLPTKVSLMSFTDNDGETWTPSQGSGINSGIDHQTIGGGPYARNADGSLKGNVVRSPLITYPNAVYYASQDIAVAEIARSDDGGLTFGVAVPMYDLTQCNGLHGHIKVAPDGTVYVPNKGCGTEQAVVVSEDNGLSWSVRKIPGSKKGHSDPSVGIGTDGTIYVGYSDGDSKARVAVSHDKGLTWVNDQDVGYYLGIQNSVFPAVTAGDGDRAAFFFLGTDVAGSGATSDDAGTVPFAGVWYGYISTTYDGGKSWVTVKVTADPVQRGVVCTNGTTCPSGTRNLLDFNDLEVDKQGRPVAAFADGCVTDACKNGPDKNNDGIQNNRFDNDGAKLGTIIRQTGGKSLFAMYDIPEAPTNLTAAAAETSGSKKSVVWLNWRDNSNDEAGFKIERSTSATTGFAQIATVAANATAYTDSTVQSRKTYYYRVRAYNSNNTNSAYSNTANVYVK